MPIVQQMPLSQRPPAPPKPPAVPKLPVVPALPVADEFEPDLGMPGEGLLDEEVPDDAFKGFS
jgi:hypothetical protein